MVIIRFSNHMITENVQVFDHQKERDPDPLGLDNDLFVVLHFNGYYEL